MIARMHARTTRTRNETETDFPIGDSWRFFASNLQYTSIYRSIGTKCVCVYTYEMCASSLKPQPCGSLAYFVFSQRSVTSKSQPLRGPRDQRGVTITVKLIHTCMSIHLISLT